MPPPDPRLASARAWLRKAEGDLEYGKMGVASGKDRLAWGVCWHAQQAAEKALKAYLAWLGDENIPHTHYLDLLRERVISQGGEPPSEDKLLPLNRYAPSMRYPQIGDPALGEAALALRLARQVVQAVKQQIKLENEERRRGSAEAAEERS